MNLNDLARNITQLEGGKHQVNIAQTKEILAKLGLILANLNLPDATKVINKLIAAGKK